MLPYRRSFAGRASRLATFAILLPFLGCKNSPTAPAPEDFAVLFVGNSLTYVNDLPDMLKELFVLGGAGDIVVRDESFANAALEDHWFSGTRDLISGGNWDVVVMQQGPSATEGRPSLLEYTEKFGGEIRAAGGEPALYMVWPASARIFDFAGVSSSYGAAADLVEGKLFPAGEAWLAAWRTAPELALYGPDLFHPSPEGSYLAALVMYQQLSGKDPRALPPRIPGAGEISQELADILQQAAFEANANFAR